MAKVIRLDYDNNIPEEQIREQIKFAAEITGVRVKKIVAFPSRNGGRHVYVFADYESDIQAFMFRYYANEDRRRINADIRRWKYGYPVDYSYLFYAYIRKPKVSNTLPTEFELWDFVLAIAVRHYPLYGENPFPA
jgi:hypothetical protein